jgi:hypothetical protein
MTALDRARPVHGVWRVYLLALLLACTPTPWTAAQNSASPRVVAIGDIHGDFDSLAGILKQAGLTDANNSWSGGNATFVQVGDSTDRGAKVRPVLDLLMALEEQAKAAGGRVALLLGNHEVLNLIGEGGYVTPEIYATFADDQSEQRRLAAYDAYVKLCAERAGQLRPVPRVYQPLPKAAWMDAHPVGFVEYREAFSPQGTYGRWLRTKPAVLRVNDTVFMHAGINPDKAPRALDDINKQVASEIKRFDDFRNRMIDRKLILPFFTLREVLDVAQIEVETSTSAANSRTTDGGAGGLDALSIPDPLGLRGLLGINSWALVNPDGPLWFRGFATWSAEVGAIQSKYLLQRYNVAHFVVGHTIMPNRRITPRFSSAVFLIDTGMLASYAPRGVASALEISDGRFSAIYADERMTLLERDNNSRR